VTVTKRFEADEFPVPAIAFNFESRRSEPVTVRLSDVVPDDVAVEDLGFHPEYGSEYWTIDDDEISFEREIEPDGEYTTVYGIRATGTDNVEQFLTEPQFDEVDPPLEDDEGRSSGTAPTPSRTLSPVTPTAFLASTTSTTTTSRPSIQRIPTTRERPSPPNPGTTTLAAQPRRPTKTRRPRRPMSNSPATASWRHWPTNYGIRT